MIMKKTKTIKTKGGKDVAVNINPVSDDSRGAVFHLETENCEHRVTCLLDQVDYDPVARMNDEMTKQAERSELIKANRLKLEGL